MFLISTISTRATKTIVLYHYSERERDVHSSVLCPRMGNAMVTGNRMT